MNSIQKEKIAHEKHLLSQGVDFKYLPNIQYNELENVYELIEWGEEYSEALNEINSSWCTWQAAKAQAVPDMYTPIVLALEDVQSKIAKTSFLTMDEENEKEDEEAHQNGCHFCEESCIFIAINVVFNEFYF